MGVFQLHQIPKHYGIKLQLNNTELDQFDHLSWSAWGPAGKGHMLFHKVRRLLQCSTARSTICSHLGTLKGMSFLLNCEVASCQTGIHLKHLLSAEMQRKSGWLRRSVFADGCRQLNQLVMAFSVKKHTGLCADNMKEACFNLIQEFDNINALLCEGFL